MLTSQNGVCHITDDKLLEASWS